MKESFFLSCGNDAIKILHQNGILNNDTEVLVPAYTCADVVDCLSNLGIGLNYYEVDDYFRLDLNRLKTQLTENTQFLLITHYFGIVQRMEEIVTFCRTHGLWIIEDCAHTFLSATDGKPVGTWGDFSLFSFKKTVPIPNGGALRVNNRKFAINKPIINNTAGIRLADLKWMLKSVALRFESMIGRPIFFRIKSIQAPDLSGLDSTLLPASSMPSLIRGLLKRFRYEEIILKRNQNYRHLAAFLRNYSKIEIPYPSLSKETSPMALPMLLRKKENLQFCLDMNRNGVDAYPWPWLSKTVLTSNSLAACSAKSLAQRLVLLPVHQDLTIKHMEYIGRLVKNYFGE